MQRESGARDLPPAPGDLRLVQAFVNTADFEADSDELASPRALGEWLASQGLLQPGGEVGPEDLERALAVREGWRALLDGSQEQEAATAFEEATAAALLRARHIGGGAIRLEPAASGFDGVLGRLLSVAAEARIDGRWRLLRVCASPTCRAVFYDHSTNHTGKWCRPRCGNRASSRASKRRRRRALRAYRESRELADRTAES